MQLVGTYKDESIDWEYGILIPNCRIKSCNEISVVYSVCSTCRQCIGSIRVLITGMWKCIGLDSFACGFRFFGSGWFFLRFAVSNRPQCPLLDGLVKLFGSSRNCSQLHMDYAVIHRKVSCQFFCFYYETVSWSTIK